MQMPGEGLDLGALCPSTSAKGGACTSGAVFAERTGSPGSQTAPGPLTSPASGGGARVPGEVTRIRCQVQQLSSNRKPQWCLFLFYVKPRKRVSPYELSISVLRVTGAVEGDCGGELREGAPAEPPAGPSGRRRAGTGHQVAPAHQPGPWDARCLSNVGDLPTHHHPPGKPLTPSGPTPGFSSSSLASPTQVP